MSSFWPRKAATEEEAADFSPHTVDDSGLLDVFFFLLRLLLLGCRLFQSKNWCCRLLYFLAMLEKGLSFVCFKEKTCSCRWGHFYIGAVNEPGEETDLMFEWMYVWTVISETSLHGNLMVEIPLPMRANWILEEHVMFTCSLLISRKDV